MRFIIDLHFEHPGYNAIVHLVTPAFATTTNVMNLFYDDLCSALNRRNVINLRGRYYRIDDNPILEQREMEYYRFYLSRATAQVQIDEFKVEYPDQSKSLYENLVEKIFNGQDSVALIGPKNNIQVRVMDKETRNPIDGEIYYFGIELINSK